MGDPIIKHCQRKQRSKSVIRDQENAMKRKYEDKKENERDHLRHKRQNDQFRSQENQKKHNIQNRKKESQHKKDKRKSDEFKNLENEKRHSIENRKRGSQYKKDKRKETLQ